MVDAAKPESLQARDFGMLVDKYLEDTVKNTHDSLEYWLTLWRDNHNNLSPIIEESEKIKHIKKISVSLSNSAQAGLDALHAIENRWTFNAIENKVYKTVLDSAAVNRTALILAVEPHARRLVNAVSE